MRNQGVGDIGEIKYAIIEQDGKLSIIKNTDTPLSHPIIIDGEIKEDHLETLGYDKIWLEERLSERSIKSSEILLMTVNDLGSIAVIKKDGSF